MFPFPDLEGLTTFPLPESAQLEFKQSFRSSMMDKIIATLCGILNTGGGYLVIGVEDTDRTIIGIKTDKDMDCFLLMLDSIYHHSHIKKTDGMPLDIGTITSKVVKAGNNKELLVVILKAKDTEQYCLKDGTMWYRLSASNFKHITLQTTYNQKEMNATVKRRVANNTAMMREQFDIEKKAIKQAFKYDIERLKARFKELEGNFKDVVSASKDADITINAYRNMLYEHILHQKEEAERRLSETSSRSIISLILSCFCIY